MSAVGGAVGGTCVGTAPNTLAAGATALSFTGITIPASGSCTVTFAVTSSTQGTNPNTTSGVTSTQTPVAGPVSNTANLIVFNLPTIAKAFAPGAIQSGGTSTVTLTLGNANATTLTNASFTDTLGNMSAVGGSVTGSCVGTTPNILAAGATVLSFTGITIPASGSCTVIFDVTSSTTGVQPNTTSGVTTTQTPSPGAVSNTPNLTVFAAPTIAKAFSPTSIPSGGTSSVTVTLSNSNASALSGGAFTDTLTNMSAVGGAVTGTCVGTTPNTLAAGATALGFTGITIPASSGCTVIFSVTSSTPGLRPNTTSGVTTTQTPTAGAVSNTANLTVIGPPLIAKSFNPTTIPLNGTSILTLSITNPAANTVALTGVGVTDNFLPTAPGLQVDTTPMANNSCATGTFAPVAGATSISISGATIPVGATCTFSVQVQGTTSGMKTNTTGNVSSSNGGTGDTASAVLNVASPPTIVKAFGTSAINLNDTTSLTLTINNVNTIPLTGVAFTDPLPAGLVVSTPNGLTNSCGGTLTATAGSSVVSLTLGTVAASSSCVISLNVTGATVGPKSNTTGIITAAESGPGTTSNTDSVTVYLLTASIFDPFGCTGPGDALNVTLELTNTAVIAQAVTATATMPSGLLALSGTCAASVGTCSVVNSGSVSFSAMLAAGQKATVTYKVQVADGVPGGTQLCIVSSASFGGGPAISFQDCTTLTCPGLGPGLAFPANSGVSDQKAGSVLVYNLYTSNATSPQSQNTAISLTNTDPSRAALVHLFFVDGSTCSIADQFVCLTRQQTFRFTASAMDPGTTGYLVAVVVDPVNGCPINFNFLIGDAYVKFASGHAANLGAETFGAIAGGLPVCDQASQTATLNFDGVSYDRAPRVLSVDNIADRASGNDTLLVVNRFGGNMLEAASPLGAVFGLLFDDGERVHSFSFSTSNCQFRSSLTNSFPRTAPPFESVIPAGRSGWMKLWGNADIGILGAVINFNPNVVTSAAAFSQGHNLHKLRLTSAASLTIPVFPPSC
jgi:uncharacterized repeat protein (TIGR01451 family)